MSNKNQSLRLVGLIKPHAYIFILGLVALAGGSGINLLLPEVLRRLLAPDTVSDLAQNPWSFSALLLGLFAFQGVCFYFRHYLFGIVGQRVVASLRRDIFANLIDQEIEFFDRERVGDLVSRITSDALLIQDAVSVKLSVFIRYGFQVAVGVILMALLSWHLTIAILFSLPVLIIFSIFLGKKLKFFSKRQQSAIGLATNIADESLGGVKVVKAFGSEESEKGRFSAAIESVLFFGLKRNEISAFFSSFVSFLMNACIVLIMLYGISLVANNQLTFADLTAFMLYGVIVAVSFAFVASGYSEFVQSLGAAERIFELIDSKPSMLVPANPKPLTQPVQAEVTFSNVSFAYPTRPELNVLQDISLSLEAGKITALVGPSGSGKSTIVSLILRFYDPSAGTIRFDGQNLRDLNPKELRDQIAIVPQDALLFGVSILENLRYGKPHATIQEIEEVCRKANILNFIKGLPEGFETDVGQAGVKVSGGERQRLAIARAMLKNPKLLMLDEATSALDSENEALIQDALSVLMQGRTALVIAHRLSTIKNAHRVLVLEAGRLVQSGTHESLSRSEGLYRQLVERQELLGKNEVVQ